MCEYAVLLGWIANATTFISILVISKKNPAVGLKITSIGYALFVLYGIASQHWAFVLFNLLYLLFSIFRRKNSEEKNAMTR
jgi:hypothetical protein